MKRVMVISYCLIVVGLLIYLSQSRAPDAFKRIDIPLHVVFLWAGALVASSSRLTRPMKVVLIAIVIAVTTFVGVSLISPKIGPLVPLDWITWFFATAAFTLELVLFLAVAFGINAGIRWLKKHGRPASLKS